MDCGIFNFICNKTKTNDIKTQIFKAVSIPENLKFFDQVQYFIVQQIDINVSYFSNSCRQNQGDRYTFRLIFNFVIFKF